MVSSSNPPPSDDAAIPEAQWLDTGLAALNEGDYLTALSYLAAVHQANPNGSPGIQAQMGLVVAYERFGQPDQAIAICQDLHQHRDPRVLDWATSTLAGLAQRHPKLFSATPKPPVTPPGNPTGFVPLEGASTRESRIPPISGKEASLPPVALPDLQAPIPAAQLRSPSAGERGFSPTTQIQSLTTQIPAQPHTWRQAGRAQRWQPLGPLNQVPFWLLQAGTAIALLLLIRLGLWGSLSCFNLVVMKLSFLRLQSTSLAYQDLFWGLSVGLLCLLGLSPWILSGILKWQYGMQSLPMAKLAAASPETPRLLNRFCRQQKMAMPTLALLPTPVPISVSYGWLPRYSWIVVSQGLLDRLTEDELATVYASEAAHILRRDAILSSLLATVLQIPYLLYWHTAIWGDGLLQQRRSAQGRNRVMVGITTIALWPLVLLSALSYGVYRFLRCPTLWFSQLRCYYSDRLAVEATGNPNGLTRALLKITIGIAEETQKQGQTSALLEGFDLLAPVGYQQSLSLGSHCAYRSFETLLEWDRLNPWRYWLTVNSSHPLLGDRLDRLARYARQWRLEPELGWTPSPTQRQPSPPIQLHSWFRFLLQCAPFLGLGLGLVLGLALWLLGGLAVLLDLWAFNWLFGNRWVLLGCLPMGFSIGTFLRINAFFKEIPGSSSQVDMPAPDYLTDLNASTALPVDAQPVHLQGKLLGRRGIRNWLGQDLILQTQMGLIPLHHVHPLGPLGTLLAPATRPVDLVQQPILVVGWLRRGATPWIDLEALRSKGGKISYSGHPVWSTIVACLSAVLGSYWIYSLARLSLF